MATRGPGAVLRRTASILCGVATGLVVAIAVIFASSLLEEGLFVAGYLVGAPLLAAVIGLVAALRSSGARAAVVVSLVGTVSLAWAVLTVVGLGLYLLVPALLLCAAALLLVVAAVESPRGPSS